MVDDDFFPMKLAAGTGAGGKHGVAGQHQGCGNGGIGYPVGGDDTNNMCIMCNVGNRILQFYHKWVV